jgi:2-polyprenyl-6-hydroxyphenyl methylase / 3-demethylubiquinone-9 3-methyltransferase
VLRNDVRTRSSAAAVTADPAEGARFAALAEELGQAGWRVQVIHAFNRVRVAYISAHLPASLKRDPHEAQPPAGARIIDVGCGAGLVTEPLSRLGAEMLGIDACERNVVVAEGRARLSGAQVHSLPEGLEKAGSFDAVMSLETRSAHTSRRSLARNRAGLVAAGYA